MRRVLYASRVRHGLCGRHHLGPVAHTSTKSLLSWRSRVRYAASSSSSSPSPPSASTTSPQSDASSSPPVNPDSTPNAAEPPSSGWYHLLAQVTARIRSSSSGSLSCHESKKSKKSKKTKKTKKTKHDDAAADKTTTPDAQPWYQLAKLMHALGVSSTPNADELRRRLDEARSKQQLSSNPIISSEHHQHREASVVPTTPTPTSVLVRSVDEDVVVAQNMAANVALAKQLDSALVEDLREHDALHLVATDVALERAQVALPPRSPLAVEQPLKTHPVENARDESHRAFDLTMEVPVSERSNNPSLTTPLPPFPMPSVPDLDPVVTEQPIALHHSPQRPTPPPPHHLQPPHLQPHHSLTAVDDADSVTTEQPILSGEYDALMTTEQRVERDLMTRIQRSLTHFTEQMQRVRDTSSSTQIQRMLLVQNITHVIDQLRSTTLRSLKKQRQDLQHAVHQLGDVTTLAQLPEQTKRKWIELLESRKVEEFRKSLETYSFIQTLSVLPHYVSDQMEALDRRISRKKAPHDDGVAQADGAAVKLPPSSKDALHEDVVDHSIATSSSKFASTPPSTPPSSSSTPTSTSTFARVRSNHTTPARPLLLIPGLGGNLLRLRERSAIDPSGRNFSEPDDEVIWLRFTKVSKLWRQYGINQWDDTTKTAHSRHPTHDLYAPQDANGLRAIAFLTATSIDSTWGFLPAFHLLIRRLKTRCGYVEGQTLFGHPWDFRQGFYNEQAVRHLYNRVCELHTNANGQRVDVVTHSYGGVLLRSMLWQYPDSEAMLGNVVTMVAPWRGASAKAVGAFLNGYDFDISWIDVAMMADIEITLPSMYDVIPHEEHTYSESSQLVITREGLGTRVYPLSSYVDVLREVNADRGDVSWCEPMYATALQSRLKQAADMRLGDDRGTKFSFNHLNLYGNDVPTPFELQYHVKELSDLKRESPTYVWGSGDFIVASESASQSAIRAHHSENIAVKRNHIEVLFAGDVFDNIERFLQLPIGRQ